MRAPSAHSLLTLLRSRKHAVIRVTTFPPGSVTDLDASLRVELRVRRDCYGVCPCVRGRSRRRLCRTTALSEHW